MEYEITEVVRTSSEVGAVIERAEIYTIVLEMMNKAIAEDDLKAMNVLSDILSKIASRSTSNTTSEGDN